MPDKAISGSVRTGPVGKRHKVDGLVSGAGEAVPTTHHQGVDLAEWADSVFDLIASGGAITFNWTAYRFLENHGASGAWVEVDSGASAGGSVSVTVRNDGDATAIRVWTVSGGGNVQKYVRGSSHGR